MKKAQPYQYLSVRWDITERKKTISALEESEKRYSDLFHLSPLPKWIYSIDTLRFLNVNEAAVKHYGYSRAEFLSMTISDIRPAEELHKMNKAIAHSIKHRSYHRGIFIHRKKNQEILYADVHSNCINYKGETAIVVLANDITERLKYIKAVEQQNEKLKEISWVQSHLVRAPLARIKGLIPLINDVKENIVEREKMCEYLLLAANELDEVIATITNKTDVGER